MATQSPFSLFEGFLQNLPLPAPPDWMVEESQRRMVLLINHVLMQEPQATERLVRQKGNVILAQWRNFTFRLRITPAGLFDLAPSEAASNLTLVMTEESPVALAQTLMQGQKPAVRIEGDVQLAAELNWLADHVRWDLEEDLSKLVGDAPAHMMAEAGRTFAGAVAQFVGKRRNAAATPAGNGA